VTDDGTAPVFVARALTKTYGSGEAQVRALVNVDLDASGSACSSIASHGAPIAFRQKEETRRSLRSGGPGEDPRFPSCVRQSV
jgi:hypothetical protein